MIKKIEGMLDAKNKKYVLVVSRFNEFISNKLVDGAIDCLVRHGAEEKNISIVWVPGALEIPVTAAKLVKSDKNQAIICLGAIIRGDTPHFDYVANEAVKGIAQVSISTGKPVIFGIITANSIEQAIERAGTKAGNKGWDAALSAIEMSNLLPKI
ncbi:MAG: 6,7-dimethyl-8-ribityllumazine synthase [Calditrichia bacterium]